MAFLRTFRNAFLRNKKMFPKKTFRDFETNFPETKKCFELFCFEKWCNFQWYVIKMKKIKVQLRRAQLDKPAIGSGV